MNQEFHVDYDTFFELRRERIIRHYSPPTIFHQRFGDSPYEYKLWMNIESTKVTTFISIEDSSERADFENNKIQYSGKMQYPKSLELRSHDFSDSSKWSSLNDSSYITDLEAGYVYRLKRVLLTTDKDSSVPNGNQIKMAIWTSLSASCPDIGSTRTAYGMAHEPPILVGQNVQSGWIEIAPDFQAFKQHVYFSNFAPQYVVTEFTYDTIEDLSVQAEQTVYKNTMKLEFPYMKNGIRDILFRTSLKERVELFISGDTELNRPSRMLESGFDVPSICAFMFDKYEEF